MKGLYQCYKDKKDIKTCAAEYKACVEALIPDYVVRNERNLVFFVRFQLSLKYYSSGFEIIQRTTDSF